MTTLPELPLELQSHILFFSTPPYTTLRVSKLWYNLTNDIYYERLLKKLFRHRIAIEVGESYKEKFEGIWTTHFASCFQQKQLNGQLIEMHEIINDPTISFDRIIIPDIESDVRDYREKYLSIINPVVESLKKLKIPFSNEDEVEKLNLYFAIEAEAYLRKYGNDLKNMDKLLIYYSGRGRLEAVKYLISKGADPHIAYTVGIGPCGGTYNFNSLQMATWVGWMPIMKYLIEEDHADINWKNARRETVLSEATGEGIEINPNVEERIQYLVAHGLKPTRADLQLIANDILENENTKALSLYRYILNGCLKAINRSIEKNIMSEAEAQKMYKDFFDNLQKLELPPIILQALTNHLELHAEKNMITAEEIQLFFEKVYAIVDSQVSLSDEKEMSESLIYDFYIPIIKSFQSAENGLLEKEAKRKRSAEEIDNDIGKKDPPSKMFKP